MRERINRLAKGILDTELPRVAAAPVSIDDAVRPHATVKKEFYVGSLNGLNVKGLVYSSNARVKVPVNAFGGLRNHIAYEVDTMCMPGGASIEGHFDLVTNAGEYRIPYVFHVETAASGQVIGTLLTAQDFAKLAAKDNVLAIRLLEYQDFVDAPFMQDLRTRAIYDTLKGHGSRHNFLEEFLVALGEKEPVRLTVDTEPRTYLRPAAMVEDTIEIRRSGWGYVYLDVQVDGGFIQVDKPVVSQEDFDGGIYHLNYRIRPEHLHAGRNFGAVSLVSVKGTMRIPIEAVGEEMPELQRTNLAACKDNLRKYFSLRLTYESGTGEKTQILNQMQREVDALCRLSQSQPLFFLLQAELCLLTNRQERAAAILEEVRMAVFTDRERQRGVYCFFQYLQMLLTGNRDQREALIRLLHKYLDEDERQFYLFYLLLKTDESLYENPGTLLASMRRQYENGCQSPLLYIEGCRLLEREPELLRTLAPFELHCLYYGVRSGMVSERNALTAARLSGAVRGFGRLYYYLLTEVYKRCPEPEVLSAVCGMLIKGDLRQEKYFPWYERGVEAKISLTRLYEYFLYSLPKNYDRALPKEVLLYFTYDKLLDRHSRSVLYKNILLYVDKEDPIYKGYERTIEKFAVDQLFEGRINSRLAVIYKHVIYRELIDGQVARQLPSILSAHRIQCQDAMFKYVVVSYEEIKSEDAYPLRDGVAYVPLFSGRAVIQFQDAFGNRYMQVPYEKEKVMDEPELLKRCYEVYPDHPMLRLMALSEAAGKDELDEDDISLLEHAMEEMDLRPLYRGLLLSRVIGYYKERIKAREEGVLRSADTSYLLCLDKRNLSAKEQTGICETLITQNYCTEAYDMIREFRLEEVKPKLLMHLCGRMILQNLFDQDELLLHLSFVSFDRGLYDSVILDYLCEHFNGTVDQMYRVLKAGVAEHVETYDLEERLLAQMLFTGDTARLDEVFDLYVRRKKTGESIVKAYFTVKCADYFLREKNVGDQVFAYLEGAVNNSVEKDKVPDIYLLALTKYYSTLPALDEERSKLCRDLMSILIREGMVFAYFKDLSMYVNIPGDIMDKEIIEYHGSRDKKPVLKLRIVPGMKEFKSEEMRQVYKGIYVKEKVLFEGEVMEYRIYEETEDESGAEKRVLMKEGSVSCQSQTEGGKGNRFDYLNQMSLSLERKDEETLRKQMTEYLVLDAAVRKLFPLS